MVRCCHNYTLFSFRRNKTRGSLYTPSSNLHRKISKKNSIWCMVFRARFIKCLNSSRNHIIIFLLTVQPKTFLDYRPNFLQPLPQKRPFFLGGMFFQLFFLTNGSSDKFFLSRLRYSADCWAGRSNHAATVSTFEFSKIAKISAILSKFWHFFFQTVILVQHR